MKLRLFLLLVLFGAARQETHHIVRPRPRRLVIIPFVDTMILDELETRMIAHKRFDFRQVLLDRVDGIRPPAGIRRINSWPIVRVVEDRVSI